MSQPTGEGTSTSTAAEQQQPPTAIPTAVRQRQNGFLLLVTGQIDWVEFISVPSVYCKYCFVYGPDWRQVGGLEEGISATGHRPPRGNRIALNTPIEATFSATNPFKWPQIVLSFYGPDPLGNDVVRGYAATHLPTVPGRTNRKCPVFVPQGSSTIQRLLGLITGRRAEFVDARICAMSEARDVTRVSTQGFVGLTMNAVLRDTKKFGYDMSPQTTMKFSEFPLDWPQAGAAVSLPVQPAAEQRRPVASAGTRAAIETIHESEEEMPATQSQEVIQQVETTVVEHYGQT